MPISMEQTMKLTMSHNLNDNDNHNLNVSREPLTLR